jgi:hypothetical protein
VARKRGRAAQRRAHSCATTTPSVRRAIQASEEKNTVLAERYDVNRKTIAKWKREFTSDEAEPFCFVSMSEAPGSRQDRLDCGTLDIDTAQNG